MLDARLRPLVNALVDGLGQRLAGAGVRADHVTIAGCALGIAGAVAIATGAFTFGLALFLLGRIADGLDGAVARASRPTDLGGYLDITLDFVVYAAIPLAFAVADPAANGLAAAALLAGFLVNGSAFLAFAIMAEKRGITTEAQGVKSLYYLTGLAEGAETIAVFTLACLLPAWFAPLAWGFAGVCLVSGLARIGIAVRLLR